MCHLNGTFVRREEELGGEGVRRRALETPGKALAWKQGWASGAVEHSGGGGGGERYGRSSRVACGHDPHSLEKVGDICPPFPLNPEEILGQIRG